MAQFDVASYFVDVASMGALVMLVTAFITKIIQVKGTFAWVVSALVSAVVTVVGGLLDLGVMADLPMYQYVAHAAIVCLAANGIFSWDTAKGLLSAISLYEKGRSNG